MPANPYKQIPLEFDPSLIQYATGEDVREGISTAVFVNGHLWLANDETSRIERLTFDGQRFCDHQVFELESLLDLPIKRETNGGKVAEMDIEGMAFDQGTLWLVSSHSSKRKKASGKAGKELDDIRALATVQTDGNRYILARVPCADGQICDAFEGTKAAKLTDLIDTFRTDPHLAPFINIPGKDNGLDVEGLAVCGDKVFVGLRGPVLRGWAMVLEFQVKDAGAGRMKLKRLKGDQRYFKHFLNLNGLGVRDLMVEGDDLIILAGPTMELDGPVKVVRWKKGCLNQDERVVSGDALVPELELPYGLGDSAGYEHAEGMTSIKIDGQDALLVLYDAPWTSRKIGESTLVADAFLRSPSSSS
jgi:hypothetical protein